MIPGQKYDTLTTSDSGWEYDVAVETNALNALAENNTLSHAPYGLYVDPSSELQPLIAVLMYRGASALNSSVTLMDVVRYYAPLIFALSLIPIFLIGRELGGDLAGCASVFFAVTMVSPIYWHKVGAFDREPIQLILGAWAMFLTIKLFKASRQSVLKFALLAGMVYGLFGLAWAGWHYVIAITILGMSIVLLLGFLGRFARKIDVVGNLLGAIRGHLDLLIGWVIMMLVITLVLGVLGGKSPDLWVTVFGTYAGYLGIGGGEGISVSTYASEMQALPRDLDAWWEAVPGKFYAVDILTTFVFTLIILAFLKFIWSRKRWEILTFAWLIVLLAMVWPGAGQARFERMWWPFVPAMAGVGVAVCLSVLKQMSFEPSMGWLRNMQNPLVLILVAGMVVVPFGVNAHSAAEHVAPPTEWRGVGFDEAFMETFDWIRENTPENSIFSIQWSFGHLFTGVARRPTVVDGAEVPAREGTWENDPTFVPRPPDYIYYVEGDQGLIYGVDVSPKSYWSNLESWVKDEPGSKFGSFEINGRRIDVEWFPMMGGDELEWYLETYRDNYGVKIDYVIFSVDEYSRAYGYYQSTQIRNILLVAERLFDLSQLHPTSENGKYVFNFGENREAVVLDYQNGSVYLRTDNGDMTMDGYGVMRVSDGQITDLIQFNPPTSTPDIEETLILFLDEEDQITSARLVKGVSEKVFARPIPVGVLAFSGNLESVGYMEDVFTSSNGYVRVFKIYHLPSLAAPADNSLTNDNTPEFKWYEAVGGVTYELQVDDNADFSSPEIHEDNLSARTYMASTALPDGDYFWRVAAYDSAGNLMGWSDVHAFAVDTTPPEMPTLHAPENGAQLNDNTPTFEWAPSFEAQEYRLLVDENSEFSSPEIDLTQTENSYTSTTELPDDNYYWMVIAIDRAGNESESLVRTFSVLAGGA
ncbi:MAG: hypothetical protein DRN83_02140 [Hadesarchaea archaeon]|nr:MAG: hypothetical protein DRN83_02140 [Hadesarchaea archaeon]